MHNVQYVSSMHKFNASQAKHIMNSKRETAEVARQQGSSSHPPLTSREHQGLLSIPLPGNGMVAVGSRLLVTTYLSPLSGSGRLRCAAARQNFPFLA